MPKALGSELVQGLMPPQVQAAAKTQNLDKMAIFFAGLEGAPAPGTAPEFWAVMKTRGTTLDKLRAGLAEKGTKASVAGTDAYTMMSPMPFYAPGAAAGRPPGVVITAVDDTTLLLGSTEDALAGILAAYEKGQGDADLSKAEELAKGLGDAAIKGGIIFTEEMKAGAAGAPPWVAGAEGCGFSVALARDLEVSGLLRLGSPEEAEQVSAEAEQGLAQAAEQMRQPGPMAAMMQPYLAVVEKLEFSADGSDVHGSLKLTKEELTGAIQGALQMMVPPGAAMPPGTAAPGEM